MTDLTNLERERDAARVLFEHLDHAFKASVSFPVTFALEVQALRTRAGAFWDQAEARLKRAQEQEDHG